MTLAADPPPAVEERAAVAPGPLFEGTLGAAFVCSGHGLHTAKPATVRVSPAPTDHGLVFRRTVSGEIHDVPALWPNRRSRPLCTALQVGEGPLVRTVEHLLAALAASAIDNALIEIDAEELPILDGSAKPWCDLIDGVGRVEQDRPRRYIRVRKRVRYRSADHKQTAEPAPEFRIYSAVTLSHFGQLRWEGRVDAGSFRAELAASRSFGRVKWALPGKIVGFFRREPVLRGANAGNTAALWGKGALGGLRWPDEPVRHRALDLVGDLALAGMPIVGKMIAIRPGHEHNYGLLETLMTTPAAWDVVTYGADGRPRRVCSEWAPVPSQTGA